MSDASSRCEYPMYNVMLKFEIEMSNVNVRCACQIQMSEMNDGNNDRNERLVGMPDVNVRCERQS